MREDEFFFLRNKPVSGKVNEGDEKNSPKHGFSLEFFFRKLQSSIARWAEKARVFLIRRAYLKQRKQHGGLKSNKKF